MTLAIKGVNHSVTVTKNRHVTRGRGVTKGIKARPCNFSAQLQNPLAMTDIITVMTVSTKESDNGQYPIVTLCYTIRSSLLGCHTAQVLLKTETESSYKTSTKQHGVTIQMTIIVVLIARRNSNLLQCYILPYTSFATFCAKHYHLNSQLLNTVTQTNCKVSYDVLHLALLEF
jgi:hypothetical protein